MKNKLFAALFFVVSVFTFEAQTISVSYNPSTGDAGMDGFLKDVNAEAKLDLGKFKADVSVKFNVAAPKVDELLLSMVPGDVYMSLQIGQSTNKPVEEVKTVFLKNKGKGWGVMAKELGIKPGSPEFHALKKSMKKPGNSESGNDKDKEEKGNSGKGNSGKGKGHGKK